MKNLLGDFAVSANALLQNVPNGEYNFDRLPSKLLPRSSPYGDGWDVLWFGHCGMRLPPEGGLVIHENDITVPQPQYLRSWNKNEASPLSAYPDHTRVVTSNPRQATCTLAYAVTQSGARKILYELGLRRLDASYDVMLRDWCQGSDGRAPNVCLGSIPQLFDHHRRIGPGDIDSDISPSSSSFR